jgi:hypothetical protein
VRNHFSETADGLRMNFYIPAARAAAHRSSWMLDRLPEGGHHVFPHLLDELAWECALVRHDSVALQSLNVGIDAAQQSCF